MRLGDTLARRRCRYPRPVPTLPDLLVIDVPPIFAAPTLPLGRYHPVIIETDDEWREWERFLDGERIVPIAPDLLDRRPFALIANTITFAHYDPPAPGWPWILLCQRPPDHVALAADPCDLFARSAYSIEIAPDPATRKEMEERILQALARRGPIEIVCVPRAPAAGTA